MTEGGTAEFTYSVSSTVTTVNSQYYNSDGNPVSNISDASTFSATTQTTTTKVDINMDNVSDKASVTKTSLTSTFEVSKKSDSEVKGGI